LKSKRVLIVYYSFTQQTRVLLKKFVEGLEGEGVEVALERLEPVAPYTFPFKTNLSLAVAMVSTFFRQRTKIRQVSAKCFEDWDCVVIAGPTWSYHPSGPILDFLDRYGQQVCTGKEVIPFISCRSYWRLHYWTVKHCLNKYKAKPAKPIVFLHPIREPWRFIGLVLQLRGKMVRKENSWFRKHYPGYGHNKGQGDIAKAEGQQIAQRLLNKE
jgi:menaquinone-dependent protoporphyrinogen IX oxidase